jgi:hypothetical protein
MSEFWRLVTLTVIRQNTVSWNVKTCSLVETHWYLGVTYCPSISIKFTSCLHALAHWGWRQQDPLKVSELPRHYIVSQCRKQHFSRSLFVPVDRDFGLLFCTCNCLCSQIFRQKENIWNVVCACSLQHIMCSEFIKYRILL